MKRFPFILVYFLSHATLTTEAQCRERVKGIYKTGEDFLKDTLSFSYNCNTKSYKIKLNDLFNKPYVSVKQNGNNIRIYKATIFGYKTCCNNVYRFNAKQQLLLLNAGEPILVYKDVFSKAHDGRTNVTNYYFSIGVKEPVQVLTIKKLKAAFPLNTKFHQLIDEYFKYNTDLAKGDLRGNRYLINKLLKMSISNG